MADRKTPRPRARAWGLSSTGVAVLALAALSPGRAVAEESIGADEAQAITNEVDEDIARMRRDLEIVGKGFVAPVPSSVSRVERRLREAEIHLLLNDHLRASIVLLDVVEDETARSHAKFDDCLYLLGESLRRAKSYSGARTYFEELLPRASGKRLQEVVLALLEIASATDRYDNVEHYIERLRGAGGLASAEVDYIHGKMLFRASGDDPAKIQRAVEVFRAVPASAAVGPQASYYAGVALVKLGRFEDAVRQFNDAKGRIPAGASGQSLRELTALSLGRLYQEIGDAPKSADAYQDVPQSSPYFGDMLYEVAWTHVRAANLASDPEQKKQGLVRALRATEILMATAPASRLYPQARILEGNLQIRLGASETAYDTFQTIIDRYGAARDKLSGALQGGSDAKQFFDQLIAADLGTLGSTSILPPIALEWALEEAELRRAVAVNEDLGQSDKDLAESEELVRTLREALDGEKRYGLFPGMRQIRTKAMSVENRLVNANRLLLNLERRITLPQVGPTESAQLDALHARVAALEAEVRALPQTEEAVEASKEGIKREFQTVGQRAYRQTYRLSTMRAQIVATESWINQNRDRLSPEEASLLEQRIAAARADVTAVEAEVTKLQGDIRSAEVLAGVDGGSARSRKLREEYAALVGQELALLRGHRERVPGDLRGVLSRVETQRAAMQQIDQDLRQLQASMDQQVDGRVRELQAAVATEADRLQKYTSERGELRGTTDQLLGPVASRTLARVGEQFRDLVLQADVGIIDVAWARKQAETKKVNDLIREQQNRTSELDSEFADVLEE